MKILLTGSNGRLGKAVIEEFQKYPEFELISTSRETLDFTNNTQVFESIKDFKPDIFLHLGAKTSIPPCEKDKLGAYITNVIGTEIIATAIRQYSPKTRFIYMSTPCIFSGEEESYNESSVPNPKNYYGLTKAMGENFVRTVDDWTIVRSNFVPYEKWMYPKAFDDRKSNYLFAHDLAKALAELCQTPIRGIIHVVGEELLSMYQLAKLCPESETVQPTNLEEYYLEKPSAGQLTKNMVLISERWKKYKITKKESQ